MYDKRFSKDPQSLTMVDLAENKKSLRFDHRGLVLPCSWDKNITYAVPNLELKRPVHVECTYKPGTYSNCFIKLILLGYSITI